MAPRGWLSRIHLRVLPSVLLTAAILLVPAMLYAWGRQADTFAIERIVVKGERRVPEKRLMKVLRREFRGHNLFTVTSDDVREALRGFCYVATVDVDRDFPTTLRVRLTEHRPVAYVLGKGRWYVVADGGHVICEVKPKEAPASGESDTGAGDASSATSAGKNGQEQGDTAAGGDGAAADSSDRAATLRRGPPDMRPVLPRLAAETAPVPGQTIADEGVRLALRVVAGLPASLRKRVEVVRARPDGQISLDIADGPRVEFGGGDRLVAKVLALRAVLAAYRRGDRSPTYIDVTTPDRPLARPRLTS